MTDAASTDATTDAATVGTGFTSARSGVIAPSGPAPVVAAPAGAQLKKLGWYLFLTLLALVMLVVLVIFRRQILPPGRLHRVALGLVCGGIVGNLFDRLRLDYVTDFLDFLYRGWHFPAFNIADAAICIGVGIYLLGALLAKPPPAA